LRISHRFEFRRVYGRQARREVSKALEREAGHLGTKNQRRPLFCRA